MRNRSKKIALPSPRGLHRRGFPARKCRRSRLREIFSEPDGTHALSFARISTAIWLAACITWISCYLCFAHRLPEGHTLFGMAAIGGFIYPANKVASAISRKSCDDQDDADPKYAKG